MTREEEKRAAAARAAELVRDGMRVGLGTGSTVSYLLTELAERHPRASYVASSPRTEAMARQCGLTLLGDDEWDRLDLTIDGADQVAPDGWLIKGGGGAHAREKILASGAERFVVIVDASKVVARLGAPVPLEIGRFGWGATLWHLGALRRRDAPETPDGGLLFDYLGPVDAPRALAERFSSCPGVLAHGLFAPELVDAVLVGADRQLSFDTLGGPVER